MVAGGFEIGLWALLIIASVTDLLWGKIYNWTNGLFLVGAIALHWEFGGFSKAANTLLWVFAAFVVFFPFYYAKILAAGDVKLLIVITAWSSLKFTVELALVSVLIGAVVGVIVLLKKNGFKKTAGTVADAFQFKSRSTNKMPFAPAFLCAFFAVQVMERFHWRLI